ncbi:hypothetical protein ACH79_28695 [Bradyrhizobium sp. CCBAU 051011]|uniref:hypothetical protein n=1 Tax=Bradyrhizobium sp. CCBAU 051011 TaxID=858422 RepID=UPI0013742902|nr:hypothetical protein [Bradyrhizobium sp. CCBAU 051011]QHO75998.1 hypothetical protein ACH79_28695 [Bradyrhizobium sp. CCBAU 051011]
MLHRLQHQHRAGPEEPAAARTGWSNQGIRQTVNEFSEVYTVKAKVWEAAGMEPMAGCLCIGCLERRLGRMLTPKDFMRNHPFASLLVTKRLLARRDGRLSTPTIHRGSGDA